MKFCAACEKNDTKKCSKCVNGYYRYSQNDFYMCDDCQGIGKYIDSNQICRNCSKNCDECVKDTMCKKCAERYFLNKENSCEKCEGLSYAWDEKESNII